MVLKLIVEVTTVTVEEAHRKCAPKPSYDFRVCVPITQTQLTAIVYNGQAPAGQLRRGFSRLSTRKVRRGGPNLQGPCALRGVRVSHGKNSNSCSLRYTCRRVYP